VKNKPCIVHVHDLLALRSALGDIPFNPISWTGKIYQYYIRQGYKQAKHFISISNKTRDDLHDFGQVLPLSSHVVYNGFNYHYAPMAKSDAMRSLNDANLPAQSDGMLLHVGGSVWYKNLAGVIRIYIEYTKAEKNPLPLWCISPNPSPQIQALLNLLPPNGKVLFFQDIDNKTLQAAYSLARVLLFPSLDEGFGWPIIEAQACGCPVMTSDAAPMNEVGGPHSIYLPVLKYHDDQELWAKQCCEILTKFLNLGSLELSELSLQGMNWVKRFNADSAIEDYLNIYKVVLEKY
jgi:glycosyltransferase involved in cell wall biosynthesis